VSGQPQPIRRDLDVQKQYMHIDESSV